ncbi:alpha/beta hydrolase [Hydrogenophaga luteola]|uniref:Alpha/beta hydrolase n=1 Tax=Hydrogenophaga luteola TaxID=1591122 RepID=A0ABV7VXT4_9BURK
MNTGTTNTIHWDARSVPVPGLGDLFSEACGPADGPPVLLVMGAMNPAHFWAPGFVAALVQAGCRVLRYDHRDTGRSFVHPLHAPPYALDALVADALRVLDAWGLARAAVVGWSMGGYIAQHLAHEHPQRVSRLVLLGSSPDHRPYMAATLGRLVPTDGLPGPAPGFLQALLDTSVRARGLPADEVAVQGWSVFHGGSHPFPAATVREQARAAMAAGHQPLAAMQHALAVDRAAPRTGWLPQLRVPTLVLHGAQDPCLPLAHGQALARLIPGARLTVLDMGHLLPDALAAPAGAQVADFIRAEAAA